jgi:hypothetical protein
MSAALAASSGCARMGEARISAGLLRACEVKSCRGSYVTLALDALRGSSERATRVTMGNFHDTQQNPPGRHDTRERYRASRGFGFVQFGPPQRFFALFVFSCVFGGILGACTPDCPNKSSPLGPLITDFKFEQQFPSDPYTAVFSFQFQSQSASITGGSAEFYVGTSQTPVTVKMSELMSASGLGKTARAGDVGAALRFSRDNIREGQVVDMRLQLVDETSLRSNCARVSLLFNF